MKRSSLPVGLRRLAIAVGAILLLLTWTMGWAPNSARSLIDRLSPENDPALLRLAVLATAANGDHVVAVQVAAAGDEALKANDHPLLAFAGRMGLAFTDEVEPAARQIGLDIHDSSPAPVWLIPCFRDAQAAIQGAGASYVHASTEAWTGTNATELASTRDELSELVGLLGVLSSPTGTSPKGTESPVDTVVTALRVSDPFTACQRISELRRVLSP